MSEKRPLNIIYGITKSNFGGAQHYVFDLATEAVIHGHKTKVLCGGRGPLVEKLEARHIPVISLDSMARDISVLKDLKSFLYILKVLRVEKPDVFHINSSKMGGAGALAARIAGTKKIIFTAHGWAFSEPRPIYQKIAIMFLHWLTVLLSHKTICVSEKVRTDISGLPFIRHKLIVIRNGIGAFELLERSEARNELDVDKDTFVVGMISELHPIKGIDIALDAWKGFRDISRAKLVLIGNGEKRDELENMAENLGISDSVIFKGFVQDARKYVPAFDIFLMSSRSEGLPYSLLEAGYAGCPTIATRVGGIPEVISDQKTGLLVEPESPDEILSALKELYTNENLRRTLGENFKLSINNHFLLEDMVVRTLNTYL